MGISYSKTNSVSFTRPADTTAYASGDQVANSTTAGSVVAMEIPVALFANTPVRIRRVLLKKSGTGVTNAAFRVHFYELDADGSSGIAAGDNAAWSTKDRGWAGSVDVTIDKAFTDGAGGAATTDIVIRPTTGSKSIYALIEARGAYTPASAEVFSLQLETERS